MKTLILILGCLLLFIPCQAAEKQPEQEKQNQQQFEEIEKYISQQRRNIESYYKGQLVELNQRAQSEIGLLEVADKAVYASLAAQAEVAKVVLHIDNYGYRAPWYLVAETERMLQLKDEHESYGDFEDSIKKSPKRFAVAQSRIAERKNQILANLEWETLKLEQRKQYALTTGLARLEKQLKENATKPKPEVTHGMVGGIVYSSKPSILIGRKIVHEWDTIQGVTVIKIYKDKVKFQKNGKRWEQKVQQAPAAYWK
jgi:hypothetical protein